ncbi:hypothetical protein TI03_04060, partial [Achromatium sp. WMS1]
MAPAIAYISPLINSCLVLALTEQAFACNPSFTAAYQHGLSQFHLNQLDAAMATYRDFAHPLAQSPRQKGLISLGMAQIFTVRNKFCLADNHLRRAKQAGLQASPEYQQVWLAYRRQRSKSVIPAAEIVCELQAKSSFSWQPRLD